MPDPSAAISPDTEPGNSPQLPLRHRPEIDGLRSLAIMPILLLHCGVTGLAGGYVGVDIFFVISGYLITAIVQREIADRTFSLAGFYRRRVVRILPALLAMVLIVLAVGCAILFPTPLADLGHSVAATAAFGSNIYFHATSDYFAQSSDLKPLVHTWSLAVEEQFYLLYPLLLLALRRLDRRRLILVMSALAVLSFAVGGYMAVTAPTAGFYLLPARMWELLVGGLIAMGAYPRIASERLRGVLCWLGLAAIIVTVVVMRPFWAFPVPLALPPVLGSALLIAYAPQTRAAALLSWKPLRWIGLISYSLYLWHRPIIAYYLLGRSTILTPADTAILLTLSFAAAIASYALIERPAIARWRSGTGKAPLAVALFALCGVAAAGFLVATNAGRMRTLPPQVAHVAGYIGFDKTPAGLAQYDTGHCFAMPGSKPSVAACLHPALDRSNVLLVGDSHAAQLSQALREAIAPAHLMQATSVGCRPLLDGSGLDSCRDLIAQAFDPARLARVSAVVLAGRWATSDGPRVAAVVRHLRARGIARVVVVGPVVEYDADVPELLGRAMLAGDLARVAAARRPDRSVLERKLAPLVAQAGGLYVSHFAIECPRGRCLLFTPDGGPRHVDHSHLTPQAALPVAGRIADLVVNKPG